MAKRAARKLRGYAGGGKVKMPDSDAGESSGFIRNTLLRTRRGSTTADPKMEVRPPDNTSDLDQVDLVSGNPPQKLNRGGKVKQVIKKKAARR